MARINYLELPVSTTAAAKSFYSHAFGWTFTDFGPTYAATVTGDSDLGLQADPEQKTAALLPVIQVEDLEARTACCRSVGRDDHPPDLWLPRRAALPLPRPGWA